MVHNSRVLLHLKVSFPMKKRHFYKYYSKEPNFQFIVLLTMKVIDISPFKRPNFPKSKLLQKDSITKINPNLLFSPLFSLSKISKKASHFSVYS